MSAEDRTPPADDVREELATHVCEECSTCGVHDERHAKCCGCYDGVCCQEEREDLEVRERLYNIIRWGTENDEMRTVDRILAEVRPHGPVTDAEVSAALASLSDSAECYVGHTPQGVRAALEAAREVHP